LHPGRRIENQTGILGVVISQGRLKFHELAPYEYASSVSDINDLAKQFGAVVASRDQVKALQEKRKQKKRKG